MTPDAGRPPTPEELVLRYREQGDAQAIGELFDATASQLFRVALVVAPDPAAAEDAVQETFLEALKSLDRWDDARPVVPWLVGILRLKAHEARRRVRRAPDSARLPSRPPEGEPSDSAASREDEGMVHEALEDLPEPYRNVAILRWRYGLSPAQIAHARGEPAGTIWSLLSRATDRLRRTLARVPAVFLGGHPLRGFEVVRGAVVEAARAASSVAAAGAAVAGTALLGGALMTKKVVAVAAAALLLVGGAGVLLMTRPDSEAPRDAAAPAAAAAPRPAPETPSLAAAPPRAAHPAPAAGAPSGVASAPAAVGTLHGVTTDREGAPILGAVVYAVAKGIPGVDDIETRPHASTDAQGRFRLDMPTPRGHWIGAIAPGRIPAFADGDGVDPHAPLSFVLEEGAEIAVRAVDLDGKPVEGAVADASPAAGPGPARDYPVPGVPGGARTQSATGPDGRAVLRAPTGGPVEVTLSPGHVAMRTEPEVVRLERSGGRAEFRVVPSCVLRVSVLDATTGRPLEGPFAFRVRQPGSDAPASGFATTNPDGSGVGELRMGLAPGTYEVEVSAEGRRPEHIPGVSFDRHGAVQEIVASLAREDPRGTGRMVLVWSDGEASAGRRAPEGEEPDDLGHLVLLRRAGPGPEEWFEPLEGASTMPQPEFGRSSYDAARGVTTVDLLPPGAYDVLAWDRREARCAFARDVRVPEGNAGNARLALVPGLRVAVRDLVGTAAVAKGVVLEAEPLGRLPVVRFLPGGWSMFDPESEIDATYALGPFPFESVTATFAGADGAPRRVVVKSGPASAAPR